MNFIQLWLAFQIGFIPISPYRGYMSDYLVEWTENDIKVQAELELTFFKKLFVYGKTDIRAAICNDSISFAPHMLMSTIVLGIKHDSFELGYKHVCTHPIISWSHVLPGEIYTEDACKDEIYLRMELGNEKHSINSR